MLDTNLRLHYFILSANLVHQRIVEKPKPEIQNLKPEA